ncbi:16S rRNA (guanine(527)-N(7))-methyltransferase RsmG [Novosphingobium terrae]|uniref:16S rRNA (guanine(527)-N(7))-methyltransferase RsmG n=1 Tax=Novosphingobium terrae TaxID=2726189 RepID=UPI001980904A|nr:16S rRNA (guanine(527)-N(7))-methyltransferase RsmG [Novosphingobium terrae]
MIADEAAALAWLEQLPGFDSAAKARAERLVAMLKEENEHQNLVSSGSLAEVWRRHIVDSAQLLTHVTWPDVSRETSGPWLDMGTGAGFPGLVIALMRPEMPVWMVESRARRVDWLQRVCDDLDLKQAKVIGSRLELVESQAVSVISARAFAPLPRLLELSARFSTKATAWLLPKGRSAGQELAELTGWQHMFHVEPSITDGEAGIIMGHLEGPADGKKRAKSKRA